MAFRQCFSRPPELTKIALQKFYKILLQQIAPFGLANRTKKVFPVFPRNIPYRARPKVPPFNFLPFCDRMDAGKSQRVPLSPFQFFSALRFFSENKNFPHFNFLMFCDKMDVENPQRVLPFSFFRHWETFSPKFFFHKRVPNSPIL